MRRRLDSFGFYCKVLAGIKRQVREAQGPEPEDIKRYYRSYATEMERSRPTRCLDEDFFGAVRGATVILVGDFHTLDQAQKQFLRIIEGFVARDIRPVVALEMVHARHDRGLQAYLSGRFDEDQFLEDTEFFDHWGFDFNHYRPILEYIRSVGLQAHGINSEGALRVRDRAMAERIATLAEKAGGRPVLVLVGDLHLARTHLPAEVRRLGLRATVLFQNSETIIMRGLRRGISQTGRMAVEETWWELGGDRFLVNNTYPWIKMMTYLSWLEHGGEALSLRFGFQAGGEEGEVDLTETLHEFIRVLASLFDLDQIPDDNYQVFSLNDLSFLAQSYFKKEPGRSYKAIIHAGRPLFMTWNNTIYIPLLDVNRTAQEAAHYLMGLDLNVDESPETFLERSHYFASGFLASKLINPMRKDVTPRGLDDFVAGYEVLKRPKERAYLANWYSACLDARGMIRILDRGWRIRKDDIRKVLRRDHQGLFALSAIVGRYIGGRLYGWYNAGKLSGQDLRNYIFEQRDPLLYRLGRSSGGG